MRLFTPSITKLFVGLLSEIRWNDIDKNVIKNVVPFKFRFFSIAQWVEVIIEYVGLNCSLGNKSRGHRGKTVIVKIERIDSILFIIYSGIMGFRAEKTFPSSL